MATKTTSKTKVPDPMWKKKSSLELPLACPSSLLLLLLLLLPFLLLPLLLLRLLFLLPLLLLLLLLPLLLLLLLQMPLPRRLWLLLFCSNIARSARMSLLCLLVIVERATMYPSSSPHTKLRRGFRS